MTALNHLRMTYKTVFFSAVGMTATGTFLPATHLYHHHARTIRMTGHANGDGRILVQFSVPAHRLLPCSLTACLAAFPGGRDGKEGAACSLGKVAYHVSLPIRYDPQCRALLHFNKRHSYSAIVPQLCHAATCLHICGGGDLSGVDNDERVHRGRPNLGGGDCLQQKAGGNGGAWHTDKGGVWAYLNRGAVDVGSIRLVRHLPAGRLATLHLRHLL